MSGRWLAVALTHASVATMGTATRLFAVVTDDGVPPHSIELERLAILPDPSLPAIETLVEYALLKVPEVGLVANVVAVTAVHLGSTPLVDWALVSKPDRVASAKPLHLLLAFASGAILSKSNPKGTSDAQTGRASSPS